MIVRGLAISVAIPALLLGGAVTGEAAVIFSFSGSGTSGNAAPAPLTWRSEGLDNAIWGIPGAFLGSVAWPSNTSVTDFHITFNDRTVVANDQVKFMIQLAEVWTPVVNGNTVDFFAPAGTSLDFGELFFVNVRYSGDPGSVTFEAHWTTADATAVPVPATLLLLGSAVAGLVAVRARRRR
jgi:hypothetical protein